MDIDKRIKQELENEAKELDEIIADEKGLFDLILGTFKGGMRRWVILVNIVTIIVSIVMIWTGYHFFMAEAMDDQLFWGVVFLLSAYAQISMKMWIFMEMNRSSLVREVKRLELAVAKIGRMLEDPL